MPRKVASSLSISALLLSIIALTITVSIAVASPETKLYIDPSETKVLIGNTFVVCVKIADINNLYGYDIWLRYNTTLLDIVSVGPPHLLPEPMIEIIEPDGIIHISKIPSPPAPPVSGSGTVASITFNATALGSCILDLFDTALFNPDLLPIPHTNIDGSATIFPKVDNGWAVIEDIHSDQIKLETTRDEVWDELVQLYLNGSERWIGGTVERYENEWGFRFNPDTIIVAEITIEVWQTTIRHISENLDYWLEETAVVGARVIEIHSPPPVGGVRIPVNKLSLLAPCITVIASIIVATAITAIYTRNRKKNA